MIEHWGVRARVTFVAFVPMVVLAALTTATHTSLRLSDLDEALVARAQAHTRQLAAASEYAVFSGDQESLHQLSSALLLEDDIASVSILDPDGSVLARAGRSPDTQSDAAADTRAGMAQAGSRHWLRIVEPIRYSPLANDPANEFGMSDSAAMSPALGTVVVEVSLARIHDRRAQLLWIGAGWMLVVALGSLLFARAMSRTVSGPIRNVAETVARIGQGQLHERVTIREGGSLRMLAEGVNEMAERLTDAHASMSRRIEEATAELRARKDEAERANLAKSRFLAAASHDLRQPLHALGLFLSELQQQALDTRSRQLIERIGASAEAMENLLDGLLDISRLDAGVLKPVPCSFDLQPVLERVVAGHLPSADARGLRLRLRCAPCWVHSDPHLLERVISNLVSNAIRYTPAGSVLVACRRHQTQVRVEVRDSGLGIAADAQHIIFQEFVQLDNDERARDKGLGLGLAIVRRLVDLLQLRLELRSAPGRGSVFAVTLPRGEPPSPLGVEENARALGRFDGLRVALVDDDPLACSAMHDLLSSWGCAVITAASAEELIAQLAGGASPDILLTDLRLRGTCDGLALIERLHAQPATRRLPAIVASGEIASETLARIHASGVQLLHKPVRPARLRALMHRLLSASTSAGATTDARSA